MEKTYVIAWKSKSRGSVGRGKALFSREEAEQVAKELNEDYPDFIHEPLNLDPSANGITEPEIFESEPAVIVPFPTEEALPVGDEVFA